MKTIVVNKRLEYYDEYIGRGTIFGNPYSHMDGTLAEFKVATREEAIANYRLWFAEQVKSPAFAAQVLALRGKRLGCFCKQPDREVSCHGDVIVEWLESQPEVNRPSRKTYKGFITKLELNQIFVFGSNLSGFHGAGSAGYASFGVAGNRWREFDYANKSDGWKGKWNVKGCAEGYQMGEEGASYAIPTVKKAGEKRSLTPQQIENSIRKFYNYARMYPDYEFFVAQENKPGLNGYSPQEMATMYSCAEIPDNVIFEEGFNKLLV
jgi:hypothetical protein